MDDKSFGWEIEFIDLQRSVLKKYIEPFGATFSKREITLVNSNGLAVDSGLGASHDWGGEINTKPADFTTSIEHAKQIFNIIESLGGKVNYRCNWQFHIGIVGFDQWSDENKLRYAKKAQLFFYTHAETILAITMGETNFVRLPEYDKNFWIHHQELPLAKHKHEALMQANTLADFRKAFFITENGGSHFANFQRQYVNIHQLFKPSKTIEFRNFYAVKNKAHIENIANFCLYLHGLMEINIIHSKRQMELLLKGYCREDFPYRDPYDHELEKGFIATRVSTPTPKKKK